MKWTRVLASATLLALVACSSGGDSVTEPVNEPPTIAFTYRSIGVQMGVPVNLTVDVTDPNDDPLTVTWQISRGALTQQNPQRTIMRWGTPGTVGTDTVRVQVTDGSLTRSVTAEIKVGTLFTSPVATSFLKANSPYIVKLPAANPRAIVQGGQTATIEAGVELLIDTPNSFFDVLGTFEANGTVDERIVIRPNDRTLVCSDAGWWDGIRSATEVGTSDGFIDFEHVEIRGATNGVRLRDNASALLRECLIVCCSAAGVLMEGNGSLRAFDSEMSNGIQDGIAIGGPAVASLPDSVRIDGCKLSINGNTGIRMDLQDTDNVVPIIVEFNEIEFNGSHGISLARAVFPSIHSNAFRGNGDQTVSNLFLQGGYPGGVNMPFLDATCNFWGSAANAQSTIDASIRDSLDSGTVGTRVDSCPWLNSSPITGSSPCTCPVP